MALDSFYFRKALRGCFTPIIQLADPDTDIKDAVRKSIEFDVAFKMFSNREISGEDFLYLVEDQIPSMDNYLEEVADNLQEIGFSAE